ASFSLSFFFFFVCVCVCVVKFFLYWLHLLLSWVGNLATTSSPLLLSPTSLEDPSGDRS
ncbi:unnamed protein product, partial [Prunus brigantina]